MNITPEQLHKILTGTYSFSQLGFSMLITRLKSIYSKDPSPYTLQSCTREANAFLNKYSNVMASDCSIIAEL